MQAQGSQTWQVIGTVPATQTTYAATGLQPGGVDYAFCVAPTNSNAATAVAYVDPPTVNNPPVVTGITADSNPVTGTTVTLTAAATDDQAGGTLIYYWTSGTMTAPGSGVAFSTGRDPKMRSGGSTLRLFLP